MIVSAFTYVRNGFTYAYPFLQSIQSLLPLVDEYVVVVGKGEDGTREAIAALNSSKIKIVDTVWDENLRTGGKLFAQQANIGMDHCRRDANWLFHLQADEVLHEKDLALLRKAMEANVNRTDIDGLLLPFLHFYGDYKHFAPSRRFHKYEIRVVKNSKAIRSYKDSMGFRKYQNPAIQESEEGHKLRVVLVPATVYHYSWARPPKKMTAKRIEFQKKYTTNNDFIANMAQAEPEGYSYREYDYLKEFPGSHPAAMQPTVASQDWTFTYEPQNNNMSRKEKFLKLIDDLAGIQPFTYKNYKRVK
jgi:hypothetical protein